MFAVWWGGYLVTEKKKLERSFSCNEARRGEEEVKEEDEEKKSRSFETAAKRDGIERQRGGSASFLFRTRKWAAKKAESTGRRWGEACSIGVGLRRGRRYDVGSGESVGAAPCQDGNVRRVGTRSGTGELAVNDDAKITWRE